MVFLDVPLKIEEEILSIEQDDEKECYRALTTPDECIPNDFLPTFIEYPDRCEVMGDFSLSVNTTLKALNKTCKRYKVFGVKHPYYAIGRTSHEYGYPHYPKNNHIDYFIYDFKNNNCFANFTHMGRR